MKRFTIIEFLKGFSIFTIVIYHYLTRIKLPDACIKIIYSGGTGVHLFILLSGLGLYLSYLNKPQAYIPILLAALSISYLTSVFYQKVFCGSYELSNFISLKRWVLRN
jgi:peptidoglycan/LPS O-acetylase OafA/YrhL